MTWTRGPRGIGSGDPHFSNVLVLNNGAGLTVDSSTYSRSLSTSGSIALNSAYPLNGADTYSVPPNGQMTTAHSGIATLLDSGEWCLEFWLRYVSASFGIEGNIFHSIGTVSVTPARLVRFAHSSHTVSILAATAVASGAFSHVAIIRDNTTDASDTRYHICIDGAVSVTSTNTMAKSTLEIALGSDGLMGFDINSPTVAFGGRRLTRNTRRYLTNSEGQATNTFTPDQYPFPTA